MQTIELTASNNAVITSNDNGLSTFNIIGSPLSISQLAKLRLLYGKRDIEYEPESSIPWIELMSDKRLVNVLSTFLRNNIAETPEVTSVNLSSVEYQLSPLMFKGICFGINEDESEISI